MRPGGVPAATREAHEKLVGGAGDGPGPQADVTHVGARVAVQREDPLDVARRAGVDDGPGAAAGGLLGRLEDQPDAPGQLTLLGQVGQHDRRAEDDHGVHVVPAGVADPRHGGRVGHVLAVDDRQRVDVGAQGHGPRPLPDVAHQAGPVGQDRRIEPGRDQTLVQDPRGADLGPGQLGVGVQVAPHGHEIVGAALDQRGQICGQRAQAHRPTLSRTIVRTRTRDGGTRF